MPENQALSEEQILNSYCAVEALALRPFDFAQGGEPVEPQAQGYAGSDLEADGCL